MFLELTLTDGENKSREYVEISQGELWQFAQLMKRTGYDDCLSKSTGARDEAEARTMISAIVKMQRLLSGVGYSPR